MSLNATVPTDVSTDVSLRVPRGEAGDLERGVADVLANVDGVTDARVDRVTGVRPTWTDIRVDASARLTLEVEVDGGDPTGTVRDRLEDGFGVTDVRDLVFDETA